VSHLFERPLCEMGLAYDFSFRPLLGSADEGAGGPCDDRPHRVEMYAANADVASAAAAWSPFALCPDHEAQLRAYDARLPPRGIPSRFRGLPKP